MWPLVVLLLLGSASRGSARLSFQTIKSVEYTNCNATVVIPCLVNNVAALSVRDMFVKWKFEGKNIFLYNGYDRTSKPINTFSSANIAPQALLRGVASLRMNKKDAVPGNYTCFVTELSRGGETSIELKYHVESWFPSSAVMPILILPMFSVLLFWGSGIVTLKYNTSITKVKIILSVIVGLVLTTLIIVGAILFLSGEHSTKTVSGLGLIVLATGILIFLQWSLFLTGTVMSVFRFNILLLQLLGFGLSVLGLSLSVRQCTTMLDSLLISGLAIILLAALLGLIYMKFIEFKETPVVK